MFTLIWNWSHNGEIMSSFGQLHCHWPPNYEVTFGPNTHPHHDSGTKTMLQHQMQEKKSLEKRLQHFQFGFFSCWLLYLPFVKLQLLMFTHY